MHLVDAQQTRRIVDRLVGYTLSPLLSRKVRGGLSAGRVQSVAVRLVVEREREVTAFVAARVLDAPGAAADRATDRPFPADLVRIDGEALDVADGEAAAGTRRGAAGDRARWCSKVTVRQQKRSPAPPFTTSTLQQEASRKLGFSPRRTMSVAQRLYEGIEIDGESVGLTTYMRTDSTAMAGVAMGEAREVIAGRFGAEYTMPKGRVYKTKAKGAQEAHEAIRPTSFQRDPDSLARWLSSDELRLYRLIWQRALASQMTEKRLETTSVELAADRYGLRASATRTLFDGFSRVYTEGRDDDTEEDDAEARPAGPRRGSGDRASTDVTPTQHFTEPPPRFTEATLIKALEEHGIGRPSTYAATISTIIDRGYVVVKEKRLHPELVAGIVTDLLVEHFGEFVDVDVHGAHGGAARRGRPRRARLGAAAARVLRALQGARGREAQGAQARGLHHRADRRGLLRGPSHGHPPRPQRPLPGLLAVSRAQGVAAAPGRGARDGGHGRGGRDLPRVR